MTSSSIGLLVLQSSSVKVSVINYIVLSLTSLVHKLKLKLFFEIIYSSVNWVNM